MKRKKKIKEANADSKKRKRSTKSDKQVQDSQVGIVNICRRSM
jgi:hypothetical protein